MIPEKIDYRFTEARRLRNNYMTSQRQARRKRLLSLIKSAIGCVNCGYDEYPEALQFDHVSGEKTGSLGSMATHSMKVIMDEVEKCQILCANCHMVKTYA